MYLQSPLCISNSNGCNAVRKIKHEWVRSRGEFSTSLVFDLRPQPQTLCFLNITDRVLSCINFST